jgi:chromosome segregation ATPase
MAGVICENKRYIYNGWTRNTLDPAKISAYENEIGSVPCELMEFDWLLNKNDFCLAKNRCEIKEKTKLSGLCFNASRVDDNTYIYVRVDEDDEIAQTNVRKNLRKTYIRCSIEVEDIKREIKELNREIKELNREKTLLNNKIQSDRQIHQYKEGYIEDLELKTIKLELKIDQYDLKVDQLNEKNTSCSEHIKHINYILDKILNMIRERKEAEKKKKQIEEVNVTGGRRGYKKNTEKKIERGGRLNNNQGLNKSKKDVKVLKKEKKDVIVLKKDNKDVMVLNKLTNRYVKRTGVLGKKILSLLNNI